MIRRPPRSTLFPYTRSSDLARMGYAVAVNYSRSQTDAEATIASVRSRIIQDRKSTRLNSSHQIISYAVFCLKKKKEKKTISTSNSHIQTLTRHHHMLIRYRD